MGIRRKGKQSVRTVLSYTDVSKYFLLIKILENFSFWCWMGQTSSQLITLLVTKNYLLLFFMLYFGAFITNAVVGGEW